MVEILWSPLYNFFGLLFITYQFNLTLDTNGRGSGATKNLEVSVEDGSVSDQVRSHEYDKEDCIAHDPGQGDHIVDAAVEDVVNDVIHLVLVVRHQD